MPLFPQCISLTNSQRKAKGCSAGDWARAGTRGNKSSSFFMPLGFSAEASSFVFPPVSRLDTSKANHA